MPTPANASTFRASRTTRLRPILIWAVIGTIVSLALVAASPWIAGQGSLRVSNEHLTRSRSWLRTEYGMRLSALAGEPPPTIDATVAVRQLHESEYPQTGLPLITWAEGTQFAYFDQIETGFPLRSFSGWALIDYNNGKATSSQGLLAVRGSWRDAIPFTPQWPIILFNAAACSFTLWALWSCPGALRRLLRRRRGLCPHCAYDLRATPATTPCPECGKLPKSPQLPE